MDCVSAEGVRIHYEVTGSGPAVVLLHGFCGSAEDWLEYGYADALARDYTLVRPDARGHGLSDKPLSSRLYAHHLWAEDVVAVLNAVGIDTAHCVGFSMGGWIGFLLMKYYPKRFESFVLMSAQPYAQEAAVVQQSIKGLMASVDNSTMSAAHKKRLGDNDVRALAAAAAEDRTDSSAALRDIQVPVLLLCGDQDQRRHAEARTASQLSPRCRFVSLPGLGHGAPLFQSAAVLPYVTGFLREASSSR